MSHSTAASASRKSRYRTRAGHNSDPTIGVQCPSRDRASHGEVQRRTGQSQELGRDLGKGHRKEDGYTQVR